MRPLPASRPVVVASPGAYGLVEYRPPPRAPAPRRPASARPPARAACSPPKTAPRAASAPRSTAASCSRLRCRAGTSATAPSVSPTLSTDRLIGVWSAWNNNIAISPPSGTTQRASIATNTPMVVADKPLTLAGATGPQTAAMSANPANWTAQLVALRPAAPCRPHRPPTSRSPTSTPQARSNRARARRLRSRSSITAPVRPRPRP